MGNNKEVRKQVLKKVRRIVVKVGSSILASREKGLHRTVFSQLTMEGKIVFSAAGRALFICLERNLTLELIRAMAEQKPERMVCLDEGFAGNDQLKANAVQIFKTKGVTSFKTV